jgi:curli biogenesis system outer membrane secretion channel CsgG
MKKMRRIQMFLAALAAAGLLSGCAGSPAGTDRLSLEQGIARIARDIGDALPAGCRVAVVGFTSPSARFNNYVLDELQGALQNSRHLTVTDRANLDALRQELGLQYSGEVDEASAVSLGKFLGAQIVVIGNLTVLGGNTGRIRFTAIDVETAVRKASPAASVRIESVWGL